MVISPKSITFYAEIEGFVNTSEDIMGNFESAGGGVIANNGKVGVTLYTEESGGWYVDIFSDEYVTDGINYIAGTYDGANFKLYINGKMVNSTPLTGNVKVSPLPFVIGNPTKDSDGNIRTSCPSNKVLKAAVFDTVLTLDEINGLKTKNGSSFVQEKKYSINYLLEGGRMNNYPSSYSTGDAISLPTPTREGYDFVGWIDTTKEYNELNYIFNSTGFEQINTGLREPNGFAVEAGISFKDRVGINTWGVDIAGAHNPDENNPIPEYGRNHIFLFNNGHYVNASVNLFSFGVDCNAELNYPTNGLIKSEQYYKLEGSTIIGNSYLTVNGTSYPIKNQNTEPMSSDYIYIFRNTYAVEKESDTPSALMNLYYEKIFNSKGEIIRDFVPVYKTETNEAGLYDKKTSTFFSMTGTGEIGYELKYPNVIPNGETGDKVYKAVWKKKMVVNTANINGDFSTEGNVVTIDSKNYKVLGADGTKVELIAYDKSSQWIPIGNIDTYLSETFYNTLPNEVKNAIVPTDIYANVYSWKREEDSSADINQVQTSTGEKFSLKKVGNKHLGIKNVFLLDAQDVVTKFGSNPTGEQIKRMFAAENETGNYVLWTRSYIDINSEYGEGGSNQMGYMSWEQSIRGNLSDTDDYIKPVFILDLSKINY